MTQKEQILSLLRDSPTRSVSCGHLALVNLYHHASQRCGELRQEGYGIEYVKGEDWDDSKYVLTNDPSIDGNQVRMSI